MKDMDLNEFRDQGYLQEVNRQFFHPLGLALAVEVNNESGKVEGLAGILDCRDDLEGIMYEPGDIEPEKAAYVEAQFAHFAPGRNDLLGAEIQPVPDV